MGVFDSLLNNTFTISRRVMGDDGQGGHPISYEVIGTAVGRIRPATSAEKAVAQQGQRHITHVLYVRHGVDIARGDMVVTAGLMMDVQGVREPSLAGEHLEVDCLEVQREAVEELGT